MPQQEPGGDEQPDTDEHVVADACREAPEHPGDVGDGEPVPLVDAPEDVWRLSPKKVPPDSTGIVNSPMSPVTPGEFVNEPTLLVDEQDRRHEPGDAGARMLMAKPATMWLTPNVVVTTASSRPPKNPPTTPPSSAPHGPYSQPHQPPNTVPRIIIPSSPMFTVPLRSAYRPPSPHIAIGAAVRMATLIVPLDVRSSLSVIARVIDIASTAASAPHSQSGPGTCKPSRGRGGGAVQLSTRCHGHAAAPAGSGGAIGGGAGQSACGVRVPSLSVSASSALRRTTS